MSSTCSKCFSRIEDEDRFCSSCGSLSFSFARRHKVCNNCSEVNDSRAEKCSKCSGLYFSQDIYSVESAISRGMDSESVFCENCLNKVNRPKGQFSNNDFQIRKNQVSSDWKRNKFGSRVPICIACQIDSAVMMEYTQAEQEYWSNAPVHVKAAKKTGNFVKIALFVTAAAIVGIILISVLVHNGSCIGPDGDYSTCYP